MEFKGHLKPENIFFKQIDKIETASKLPDILITSDINSLYHRRDIITEKKFEIFQYDASPVFKKSGLVQTETPMRFIAADAMVIVADRNKYMQTQMPREWYELLHPALNASIVFCNATDSFCHTVYAHFIRDYGMNVLKQLKSNTFQSMHPIEMVQTLTEGNKTQAQLFVMPYSYARLLEQNINYQVIWPDDGAILLPIQMLIKKGVSDKYKKIIDLFTGSEMGNLLALNGFIPVNTKSVIDFRFGKLNWLGWNFINESDLKSIKQKIITHLSP